MMRLAVAQSNIDNHLDWNAYVAKMETLTASAKKAGAHLLLMPEYAGAEICGAHQTDDELYPVLQAQLPAYRELFKRLAAEHQLYIQPGTIPVKSGDQGYANRAYFFAPDGGVEYQDKFQLTEYEKYTKLITRATTQHLFDTKLGKIGIAICYDSEFPEIVRRLVVAGATLILVPSYTTSTAGYYRVSLSCRARALENQCYVAVSFAVGEIAVTQPPEQGFGRSAVFTPVDRGYPDNGILVEANMNETGLITADLDLNQLASTRKNGDVHQYEDSKNCADLLREEIVVRKLG